MVINSDAVSEDLVKQIVSRIIGECCEKKEIKSFQVPVEASGRHVHLSKAEVETLFGKGYVLTMKKALSQPGQFICEERVTLLGPKGQIRNVAILGPERSKTQVEISMTDSLILGIKAPVKMSGDLNGAADVFISTDIECVKAKESVIIARNHIHMPTETAEQLGITDGQIVNVKVNSNRRVTFEGVIVRTSNNFSLAMHIDYDEANACAFKNGDMGLISFNNSESIVQKERTSMQCEVLKTDKIKLVTKVFERKLLTEADVFEFERNKEEGVCISLKTLITPLAKDLLRQKKIEVQRV